MFMYTLRAKAIILYFLTCKKATLYINPGAEYN